MIINYKKKTLNSKLIFGLLWLILGITSIRYNNTHYFYYGYVICGLLYVFNYGFQKHFQYLTITDFSIIKHSFFSKTILFSEITKINYFAGEYSIISDSKKLTINKELIDPSSLKELELIIEKLVP